MNDKLNYVLEKKMPTRFLLALTESRLKVY